MLLKALTLSNYSTFQDHRAFLITLEVFGGKLIVPSQFAVAVFAAHISNHVAASEHDPILNFTVLQVNYLRNTQTQNCKGMLSYLSSNYTVLWLVQ
jgi:hypothetical protein